MFKTNAPYLSETNWKPVGFTAVVSGEDLGQSCEEILLGTLRVSRVISSPIATESEQKSSDD
jgi:hypothetical protein